MGYDLHITRKNDWSDPDGPMILLAEWQELIERDRELRRYTDVGEDYLGKVASWGEYEGAFRWDDGQIVTKNPPQPLIVKMVAIAAALGAKVQGDDGEIYQPDGGSRQLEVAQSPKPGLLARFKNWLRARRTATELQKAAPAFKIGARVRDSWGAGGTVAKVDRRAMGGMGSVTVKFDDGRELSMVYIASGLELDEESR